MLQLRVRPLQTRAAMDAARGFRVAASPVARTKAAVPPLRCHESARALSAFDAYVVDKACPTVLEGSRPPRSGTRGMIAAAPCAQAPVADSAARRWDALAIAIRYAQSSAGPLCISAAHFIAAFVFLRAFARTEFGILSFLLVIVPFCLSLAGALIGVPAAIAVRHGAMGANELATYLKMNLVLGAVAAISVFFMMCLSRAGWNFAI